MKKPFFITLMIALTASICAFFAFAGTGDNSVQIVGGISFAILVPQLVAIWAFASSLRVFKKDLKVAYYTVIAGIFTA